MPKPLRIAFFLYEFPVLSETFVLNQITGLIDLGHDVAILAERRGTDAFEHPDIGRYRLRERTRYLEMPVSRPLRLAGAPIEFARNDRRSALLRSLSIVRYGAEARSLRLFYWAATLAGDRGYDIIHCHFGPRGRMAAFLREIGALRGKLVTVFHGVDASAYVRHNPRIYRHLFATGDLFLPVSDYFRGRLIEHGCDPARIYVHRMGVDLRRFSFRPPPIRKIDEPLRVLTAARLVEKKGIEFGLRALAELKAQNAPFQYTIVGEGFERPELESLAKGLGLGDAVSFLGWRDHGDIAELMRESHVLLYPSVTDSNGDQEGVPVSLMEAMATGLPVVTTRHSGIPELIEDGVTGLLAGERDSHGLADALERLLNEPELGVRLSDTARARVVADLDIEILNRRLVAHFQTLARRATDRNESRQPAESGIWRNVQRFLPELLKL